MSKLVPLLFLFCAGLAGGENLSLVPGPGTYSNNQEIRWVPTDGWTLAYGFEGADRTLPWTGHLSLTALSGEVRNYNLLLEYRSSQGELRTKRAHYTIDRRSEALPKASLLPGIYLQSQTVTAELRGWVAKDDQGRLIKFPLWLDAAPGGVREYRLTLEKEGFPPRNWTYRIDRTGQEQTRLDIMSPLAGTWANGQLVCLDTVGCDLVTWSTQVEDHPEKARMYQGPFLWNEKGPAKLFFYGRSRLTGQWLSRSIDFAIESTEAGPWPESRWTSHLVEAPALGPDWLISGNGVQWGPADQVWKSVMRPQGLSYSVVLLKQKGSSSTYRYVYGLDDTPAKEPRIQYMGGFDRRIWTWAPDNQWIQVEWQGVPKGESPSIQKGPIASWQVPDGASGARFRTMAPNGNLSNWVDVSCPFVPAQPRWEPWTMATRPYGGTFGADPFLGVVFETASGSEVPFPQENSAAMPRPLLPDLPPGDDRLLSFRMAWRDETGRMGPPTAVFSVRVDRMPPRSVQVLVSDGRISLSSEGPTTEPAQIFYAFTLQPVNPGDPVSFEPYEQPINFPPGAAASGIFLQAYARDRSGNSSPVVFNQLVQTDQKIFQITGFEDDGMRLPVKLENGGVYGRNYVLLKPLVNIPGIELYYTLTENGDPPQDVRTQGILYRNPLEFTAALGTKKSVHLAWNAQKDGEWLWKESKIFTFTLDLGAPGELKLTNQAPQEVLSSAWKIGIHRDSPGDSVYYSFTLDGQEPGDPLGLGAEKAADDIVIDAPEGQKVVVRVRIAVKGASGLGKELTALGPVTIDRQSPSEVITGGIGPFFSEQPFDLPAEGKEFLVRYTLAQGDGDPGIPDRNSVLVSGKVLHLEGQPGQRIVYHLRMRSFTATGKGGLPTGIITVIVDRTGSTEHPAAETLDPKSPGFQESLKGLPGGNLCSVPVTLPAQPGLRFAVSEGTEFWPVVGPDSPSWDSVLTLDPGDNRDRTYRISARAFDRLLAPAGPELHWQIRIDRVKPAVPQVRVSLEKNHNAFVLTPIPPTDEEVLKYFYRWSWKSFPTGEGQTDWLPLGGNLRCSVPNDQLSHGRVEVYSVDQAGNQSLPWVQDILLDQNVVYLKPGTESGTGTRASPFNSLESAVDTIRRDGRKTLFIASGVYGIKQNLDLTDFDIWGGWDTDQWELGPREGRAKFLLDPNFSGPMAFLAGRGSLKVRNFDVQATGHGETLWYFRETQVLAENCQWIVKGGFPVVWTQNGGNIIWKNISGNQSQTSKSRFLDLKNSEFRIQILNVATNQNNDIRTLNLEKCKGLLSDLSLVGQGNGGLENFIYAKDCEITGTGFHLESKGGTGWASGIQLDNCRSVFWKTDIRLQAHRGNTGVRVAQGRSEWEGLSIFLSDGSEFNLGVTSDQSDLSLRYGDVKIASADYQTGLVQTGGSVDILSSGFVLTGGGKNAWGGQFYQDCQVSLRSSLFELLNPAANSVCWSLEKEWKSGSVETDNSLKGWKMKKELQK